MKRLAAQVERYAPHDSLSVLIEGESGTGKTHIAQLLHAGSPRAGRPFAPVLLSALEEGLAGAELFGHVSGAYSGAGSSRPGRIISASGGTLFLDEIGKSSKGLQGKLLYVVESGEFWPLGADRSLRADVRIVAATNLPLADLVAAGTFLPDLEARLSGFVIRVPPLRERRADIPELVRLCIERRARECGYHAGAPEVHGELMEVLHGHGWPLNLRQLDAVLHRLLIDAEGAAELRLDHCADIPALTQFARTARRDDMTRAELRETIRGAKNKASAARQLGIARGTLYRWLADDESASGDEA